MTTDEPITDSQVRGRYLDGVYVQTCFVSDSDEANYDAWLLEHDRQIAERAWNEGAVANELIWIHIYDGHDVDPEDPFGMCSTCGLGNPYTKKES